MPVPDAIVSGLIFERLDQPDVKERGYVLEGFPRTYDQATAMVRRGIIPDQVVALEVPDEHIIAYTTGLRHDPTTGRTYHSKYDPPPKNGVVESRLTKRVGDTEPATRARLSIYRSNIRNISSCFKETLRTFKYEDGIVADALKVTTDLNDHFSKQSISKAPHCVRMAIVGYPGAGKTTISEAISKKYGYAHVSPKKVILKEIALGTEQGGALKAYINAPEAAPPGLLAEVVAKHLKAKECVDNGFVLDGFPLTKADADYLSSAGVILNR